MDLTLKHFYRVVLLHTFTASVLLELAHLVHPTNNLLLGDATMVLVHHRWLLLASAAWAAIFWLVYNFDSSDICAVTIIILELNVVVQEKVHETTLLILRQFTEDECLRLSRLIRHLTLGEGGAAPRLR